MNTAKLTGLMPTSAPKAGSRRLRAPAPKKAERILGNYLRMDEQGVISGTCKKGDAFPFSIELGRAGKFVFPRRLELGGVEFKDGERIMNFMEVEGIRVLNPQGKEETLLPRFIEVQHSFNQMA